MAIQPFLGWAPDADATTPGILVDVEMMEPSPRGMKAAPSAVVTDLPALAAACKGAALITQLDGTKRLFAGTEAALYEAGSGAWTDRTSSAYTTGDGKWRFAQFGDVTIAVNGTDDPQTSSSGAFSALTAMPVASLVATAAGFVVVANITDVAYPHADGWWCSALYDHTNWTPAIATQSARARLLDTPGPIKALRALGSLLVAYKERSMYLGQYVGPDVIWAWQPVPGEVGAFSQEGVVSDGSAHYWWGGDDFYRFDGSRPQPIGKLVRKWFAQNSDPAYLFKMAGDYDRASGLIRWYFVAPGETEPTRCIALDTRSGQWGRADRNVEALVDYVSASITYDSAGVLASVTYDTLAISQSFDSPYWLARSELPAVIDDSHTLLSLSGVPGDSSLTTGDLGDDDTHTLMRRVRLRYADRPDTAQVTAYHKSDGDLIEGETVTEDSGKFDVLQSDLWHRLRFDFTGSVEVSGMNADLQPDGAR